jgi:hypothetical protein
MATPTVSAPSSGQTIGVGAGATKQLGASAAETNNAGLLTQLQSLLGIISSGGTYALDPQLRTEFEGLQKSVAGATRGDLAKITTFNTTISTAQAEINRLNSKGTLTKGERAKLKSLQKTIDTTRAKIEPLQFRVDEQNKRVTDFQDTRIKNAPKATDALRDAFPELGKTLADAEPWLQRQGKLGATGQRLMDALGQGFQAGNISAQDVERGAVGESLYGRAAQMAQSDGRLSPEANRDAVQSARQAFAARGLGTSAGSAAAELLNRDQYSRQRMFQDLDFAGKFQESDVLRQQNNANRQLTAATANEEARRLGSQMNTGMLGQAFTTEKMLEQEGLGAALQRGQLASAANPMSMLLSLYGGGQPVGSQALGPAAGMANNWAQMNLAAQGFNANSAASMQLGQQNLDAARMAAGATRDAGTMGFFGNLGSGLIAGAGFAY